VEAGSCRHAVVTSRCLRMPCPGTDFFVLGGTATDIVHTAASVSNIGPSAVFIPIIFSWGGESPPPKILQFPPPNGCQTVCSESFFGRDS